MVRAEVAPATELVAAPARTFPPAESRLSFAAGCGRCSGVIFGNVGQWAAAGAVGGCGGQSHLLQGLFQPNLRSHRISNSLTAAKKATSRFVGNSGGRNRTQLRPWKLKLNPTRVDDWEFSYQLYTSVNFSTCPFCEKKMPAEY